MKNKLNKVISRFRNKRAYTLVELTVAVTLMSLLVTGLFSVQSNKTENSEYLLTVERIAKVKAALDQFIDTNNYVPCPAEGDYLESDSLFGSSESLDLTTGECSTGVSDYAGMVPVRTLGLPDDYAFDGWNRKFTYVIAKNVGSSYLFKDSSNMGDLKVIDLAGREFTRLDSAKGFGAIYVVISHGSDGAGVAWERNTANTRVAASGVQGENSDANKIYMKDTRTTAFDDIVVYGTKSQMIEGESPFFLPSTACVNAKLLKDNPLSFTSPPTNITGAFASQINTSATLLDRYCQKRPADACSFTPKQLGNLVYWYDGNDPKGDGSSVVSGTAMSALSPAGWGNKGSLGGTATVFTGAPTYTTSSATCKLPSSTKGCIYMPYAAFRVSSTAAFYNTDFTIFALARPTDNRGNPIITTTYTASPNQNNITLVHMGTDGFLSDMYNYPTWTYGFNSNNNEMALMVTSLGTTVGSLEYGLKLWVYNRNGEMVTASNSSAPAKITGTNSTNFGIGFVNTTLNNNYYKLNTSDPTNYYIFHGVMYEVMVYNKALSEQERLNVVSYLQKKWFFDYCS